VSRALVLSGGGPVGVGWHSGLMETLTTAGVDPTEADLIVGSSAGAMVGSQIALGRGTSVHTDRFDEGPVDVNAGDVQARMLGLMQAMTEIAEAPPQERLVRLGRLSVEADTEPEDEFLERFAYMAADAWPKRFVCTAIDCSNGAFVVWDADANVDLVRAVGSSCAVPGFFPPVTIDGKRYYDGGLRSLQNADLAAGHDRVIIVTLSDPPHDSPDPRAQRARKNLDTELAAIRDSGGEAIVVAPDDETRAVIGVQLMDPTKARAAVDAGRAQGEREAARLRDFWK